MSSNSILVIPKMPVLRSATNCHEPAVKPQFEQERPNTNKTNIELGGHMVIVTNELVASNNNNNIIPNKKEGSCTNGEVNQFSQALPTPASPTFRPFATSRVTKGKKSKSSNAKTQVKAENDVSVTLTGKPITEAEPINGVDINEPNGDSNSIPETMGHDSVIATLTKALQEQGCYETEKGAKLRSEILGNLNNLVQLWIKNITLGINCGWSSVDNFGGRIVTYGSYQLGISHQGADIDALCVAPLFISRQEFFGSFLNCLRSLSAEVTELRAIEEAYVPVIKFRYNGIEIDMTFAQLKVEQVPPSDEDLLRNDLFNVTNMDPKCLRSLNGYRATMLILQLVPNVEKFRMVLRAIKLWAQSQGIYSNILGYLGGFSWAVLVARVCMDFPDLNAAELIGKFFHHYKLWKWPQPVSLIDYTQKQQHSAYDMSSYLASVSWDPEKNVQERYQVMPILTPTYPHQNSTFNVSTNALKLIREKMCVAADICDKILKGEELWNSLFVTRHMFHEYEHFLIVVASAPLTSTSQHHQQTYHHSPASPAIQWFGLIESKIRHLVNQLETGCRQLSSARIWPKPFSKKAYKTETTKQLWFIGLDFGGKDDSARGFDCSRPIALFTEMLLKQSASFYTRDMRLDAHYLLKSQLTSHLSPQEIEEIVSFQSQKVRDVDPVQASRTPAGTRPIGCDDSSIVESFNGAPAFASHHPSSSPVPSTYASVINIGNHSFAVGRGSNGHTERAPLVPMIQTLGLLPPNQPPPPNVLHSFFNSPCHNSSLPPPPSRLHTMAASSVSISPSSTLASGQQQQIAMISHSQYPISRPRSPILEKTWTHSGSTHGRSMYGHLPAAKFSYDRIKQPLTSTQQADYSERNDSTSSSAHGLDASYSSLESDNGRSVSYSSDKFPPQVLVHARLHHGDHLPFAQLSSLPPPSSQHGCGLYGNSTPAYDSSVPPPPSPIMTKAPTFVGVNPRPLNLTSQQRLSTTEIRDVSTPLPVQSHHYPPLRFNFNTNTIQQLQASQDSVFT